VISNKLKNQSITMRSSDISKLIEVKNINFEMLWLNQAQNP